MPRGLGHHPLSGVDQDHGEAGRRRGCGHVAHVLLLTGRVGDYEAAPRRLEAPVGDVDRDALLPLVPKSVRQEGEVDLRPSGPVAGRRLLDAPKLVREGLATVVQQLPEQGALPRVNAPAEY